MYFYEYALKKQRELSQGTRMLETFIGPTFGREATGTKGTCSSVEEYEQQEEYRPIQTLFKQGDRKCA